jgi:hypothetical protein
MELSFLTAKFNTHELDQTGLSYLTFLPYGKKGLNRVLFYEHKKAVPRNARYYDSAFARFVTSDTVIDGGEFARSTKATFVSGIQESSPGGLVFLSLFEDHK